MHVRWRVGYCAGTASVFRVQSATYMPNFAPGNLRLPSFSSHLPYLIAYLLGFPPGTNRNLLVRMQVFPTGGTVRLTGTGNPTAVTVGFTSFPVSVPISVTTTASGFASVLVQRNGQTGFDWHAVDVL